MRDEHYVIRLKERSVELTDAGRAAVAEFAHALPGLWCIARAREELGEKGLSALHLFHLDRHYILADGKVQIVDEYTGRVMADRSWERGLHQMIEVKEGLDLSKRRDTVSRITYQRFFRRYLCLAGMTGTATEVAPELRSVYALDVLRIPPNRPVIRRDLGSRVFVDSERRWAAVVERAAGMRACGRAVLIGTRSGWPHPRRRAGGWPRPGLDPPHIVVDPFIEDLDQEAAELSRTHAALGGDFTRCGVARVSEGFHQRNELDELNAMLFKEAVNPAGVAAVDPVHDRQCVDLHLMLLHQANRTMVDLVYRAVEVPPEKRFPRTHTTKSLIYSQEPRELTFVEEPAFWATC